MKKKLIIGIILILLIIIMGFVYVNEINKANHQVPYINEHLNKANEEYNVAVTYLNNKSYNLTIDHINESYKEYTLAKESTQKALEKATTSNQTLQVEYFTNTLIELNYKINATLDIYEGIGAINSPRKALSLFDDAEEQMDNAKEYSDKRIQLEQQYPEKFI